MEREEGRVKEFGFSPPPASRPHIRWDIFAIAMMFTVMAGALVLAGWYIYQRELPPAPAASSVEISQLKEELANLKNDLGGPKSSSNGVLDSLLDRILALETAANPHQPEAKAEGEASSPAPEAEKSAEEETQKPAAPDAEETARAARIESLRE